MPIKQSRLEVIDKANKGRVKSLTFSTGLVLLSDHNTKTVIIMNEVEINVKEI